MQGLIRLKEAGGPIIDDPSPDFHLLFLGAASHDESIYEKDLSDQIGIAKYQWT